MRTCVKSHLSFLARWIPLIAFVLFIGANLTYGPAAIMDALLNALDSNKNGQFSDESWYQGLISHFSNYDVPDYDRSFSGSPNDCDGGCTAGEILDICDLVNMNSSRELNHADASVPGDGPAWGYAVLYASRTLAHTGSDSTTVATVTGTPLVADDYIGSMVFNETDGSRCIVTDNGESTITCAGLSGGSDNTFQAGDTVLIGKLGFLPDGYCRNDSKFGFSTNGELLYLDDVAGATVASASKPATTGYILQPVGRAYINGSIKAVWAGVNPITGWGTVK